MPAHRRPITTWFEHQPAAAERRAARRQARVRHDLLECANASEDSRRSYTLAAWSVRDPDLHEMFVALVREREQQGESIERLLGERTFGSKLAFARRAALEVRVMFGRDDRRILESCLFAERVAESAYAAARVTMDATPDSLTLRQMLAEHHSSLERAIGQLESEIRALTVT